MMSYAEFKGDCTAKVAEQQREAKSGSQLQRSVSLTPSPTPTPTNISSEYPFVIDTYRDLRSHISGFHTDIRLIQTINKYKKGCNEVYTKAFESYDSCYQLAQNIVRTMDIFKELCSCLPDLEEYNYRLCELISIFIACELRLSADADEEEQLLIAQRIIYIMRRHLVQEDEHETSYNILRTLVYIPKLFNAREIMCAIFGEFISLKPVTEVNVLPDKLYMLYIIVFYRWMMMQKEEDDKILIVNFAESFMKPSVSLCSNKLYAAYLPMYTKHSTATRTILNNFKNYGNIRNACIIDNAFKQTGAIVNLCDDDEDDVIIVDTPSTTDFAQIFSSIHLEPVVCRKSSIKSEGKPLTGTVDLTEDDEEPPLNATTSIDERHEEWLNEFHKLAKQYRDSQLILEKRNQNILKSTNVEKELVICLESDSEEESEVISAVDDSKKPSTGEANQRNNSEDLFADNYPLTNTPLNCDSDLESLDAEDENDITKISPRFLSSNLRTYQAKKTQITEIKNKNNSGADKTNLSQDMTKAYRRDSIHISSTPPEEAHDEDEDDSTDVQDENDEETEAQPYTFLPTTIMEREKEIPPKQIRPMGPYPTYNNMQIDKGVFSQATSISSSASSETKRSLSKPKKMVKFNTIPLGSTASTVPQKLPLKPALQKSQYKASDALEYYHLRGFERLSAPPYIADSTASSSKQQDHLEAAALFFRQCYPGSSSPSLSSVSSHSLLSPATSTASRKKSRSSKTKPSPSTPTRKLEMSTGAPGTSHLAESSDDCYGVASDMDIVMHERYKNDAKLRKRCAVVITPTKEIIQFERERNEMYNEILEKQRRKLELRALQKQREKERGLPGRRKDQNEATKLSSKDTSPTTRNERKIPYRRMTTYHEHLLSSESEYETTFQVRTRKQMPQNGQELQPLNIRIEAAEDTTKLLLSQIDAHLDKPLSEQTCDTSTDESQTKMEKLNLLADVAQNLSPYQLDLPEQNNPPLAPLRQSPKLAQENSKYNEIPREKVIVTEQIFIQSLENLGEKKELQLDNKDQQPKASSSYAHEPKLNVAANFKSSPNANPMQNENEQNNTQLENSDYPSEENNHKTQTDEAFEDMVDEPVNVLSVTNPSDPPNDYAALQQQVRSDSKIPIVIINVESLNVVEQNDVATQKSDEKEVHLLHNNVVNPDSENEINETVSTKDIVEDNILNKAICVISPNILGNAEPLTGTLNEKEISNTLNAAPLIPADLSDISLESEVSKHLPEVVDPSPAVTDMSDYSNESVLSKGFSFPISNINNTTTNSSYNNEMPLTDLPLVMPNITEQTKVLTSQQSSSEPNFNEFNCTLNTPTKLDVGVKREEGPANRLTSDLNTPVKYNDQPELELRSIPLNNALEAETDNNVTTFLDLILNKTVTDAESETRDKIIEELSALTADPGAVPDILGNKSNNEIMPAQQPTLNEDEKMNSSETEITLDANKSSEKKVLKEIATDLKQQSSLTEDTSKSDATSEYSLSSHVTDNSLAPKISEPKTILKECKSSENQIESIELNPPKTNLPDHKELFCDNKYNELNRTSTLPPDFSNCPAKLKTEAVKQIFNIRCRVRLKRFNVVNHSKATNNESSPAIFTTKTEELLSSDVDITKCDTVTEKTLPIKKRSSKPNNKPTNKDPQDKVSENFIDAALEPDIPLKSPKLESEKSIPLDTTTAISQKIQSQIFPQVSQASSLSLVNNTTTAKAKTKTSKTVTFDLSNLNEELRDNMSSSQKQKSKNHSAGVGFYLKNSRPSRKLPDNTLRAAETLQLFVNSINASTRTPPPAEFNKKRSPIKNKCIAEDETPRPPPASTLMGTPPSKKSCTEKSRSHLSSAKCKDQLVSSLTTSSISNINSDITTARIYTSSPLDQTLPEYDDNVDTVADTELILPTASGSLRRKLKRPKKSLSKPQPTDDVITDDISNQPDCNGEDDTDVVVDNEDDVFAEELLPIPAANEHILEEIVSARPTHIGTGTVIRDDYMNIEATATVPVYLFNDESRDLGSPEVIQSCDNTNVVDSSSYLNTSSATVPSNVMATPASATTVATNLEKSMLSPSEHEVSSTQETFYQTPTKNKPAEIFVEKSSTSKEKANISMGSTNSAVLKQKPEDKIFKNKEVYPFSSTVGLLQNNQVDTTNHSPEMCTLTLTTTTTTITTPTLTSNRKIRKASTHDEILFNELQQQLPSTKRKSNHATFCVESTSDNNSKIKIVANKLDDVKSNGSLAKADDQFKKLLKEVCKIDKSQINKAVDVAQSCGANSSVGGSSPSTTTTINEETLSKSKCKKLKSSKSKKRKSHSGRSLKTVLKASKLSPDIPAKPLTIKIPKSRLLRPPPTPTPPTPLHPQDEQLHSDFLDIPNAKLFMEKGKETMTTSQNSDYYSLTKILHASTVVATQGFGNTSNESTKIAEPNIQVISQDSNSVSSTIMPKEKPCSSALTKRKKEKLKTTNDTSFTSTINYTNSKTCTNSNNNNLIFVKDKYDLIKSKDKYHQHHNHPQQDEKEKTNSLSKSVISNSSRLHKNPAKQKVKGEKTKEKTKATEKPSTEKHQADNVLKLSITHNQSKSLSSSASLPLPAPYSSEIKSSLHELRLNETHV